MVNGKRLGSQSMIGLPLTVYCLPNALRLALCVMLVLWSAWRYDELTLFSW
jgi:hypothetical protein